MGIENRDWNRQKNESGEYWSGWPWWLKVLLVVGGFTALVFFIRIIDRSERYYYNEFISEEFQEQNEYYYAFYQAIEYGDTKAIKRIIKKHPEILESIQEPFSGTNSASNALTLAIDSGNDAAVLAVIEVGGDPTLVNADGRTPLHFAASRGNAEIINVLIEHGADVNAPDTVGFTPLFDAAQTGSVSAAQALLAAGANSSAATLDGQTPASIASEFKQPRMVALLGQLNKRKNASP